MKSAQPGDYVTVLYEGVLEDGEIFESYEDTGPLHFQLGTNSVLPGFEEAVCGMQEDETKKIVLEAEEAYGPSREELIFSVNRASLGEDRDIKPGMVVGMTMEKEGEHHKVPALVAGVSGDRVTLDFNHPLAGKRLAYTITVKKISDRPEDESQLQ